MKTVKIFIMGVTGHGKSSFINYLLGHNVAETGVGKPVTQSLAAYNAKVNGIDVQVTDTKGLEAKDAEEQAKYIKEYLERHNVDTSFDERFHSIFYCLKPPRFLDFEVNLIKKVFRSINQPVNFIITNCDGLKSADARIKNETEATIKEMRKRIDSQFKDMPHRIFEVCSVDSNGTFKDPSIIKAFGKDKIINSLFNQVWDDASYVMSKICVKHYFSAVDEFLKNIRTSMESEYNSTKGHSAKANQDAAVAVVKKIPTDAMKRSFNQEVNHIYTKLSDYRDLICSYYQLFSSTIIDTMIDKIIADIKNIVNTQLNMEKLGAREALEKQLTGFWRIMAFTFKNKKITEKIFSDIVVNIRKKLSEDKLQKELESKFKKINEDARMWYDKAH
ncbi:MAG: 50S ribosome-binding GTPase [Clostridia bacterium]|nr:50S ribosome-binding GTPase [Clostridia bacterium]